MKAEESIKKLCEAYCDNLDQIYKVCETSAGEYGSKNVPLTLLKLCIEEVKINFKRALNDKQKS